MDSLKEFISNFKYLFPAIGKYKSSAKKSMIFTSIETILELLIPTIMAVIVDKAIAEKNLSLTIRLGILMIVISLVCMYTGAVATRLAATTSSGFAANLRKIGFHKIQEFGFKDLEDFKTSSLITRLTSDLQQITFSVFLGTRFVIKTLVMAIVAVILSIRISPNLSLIFLVLLPVLLLAIFSLTTRAIPTFREFRKEFDNLNLIIQESFANIRVVKAFVRNDFEIRKFDKQNKKMFKLIDRGAGYMSLIMPVSNFIMFSTLLAIVWFGGNEIIVGKIGVGQLLSFITYAMMLLGAFIGISMIIMQMMVASPGVVRNAEIVKHVPEMDLSKSQKGLEVKDGSIDFENVFFRYEKDSDNYALSGINLHIDSGETIGILGPTGSSKSTLVQLIPRLYDVSAGQIKIGGENIENYELEELRDKVNIVLQKNTLFSGTIEENLRRGDPDASFEEIKRAAEIACADEFIMEREDGYQSVLGQKGVGVSGGQKQRLCIARSLLAKPKILILDNSTSAVDTKTEARIKDGLDQYDKDMTKIIISQRISSFRNCDRIIVMDDGRIDAIGSHEELYKTNELYRKTYDIQEKGEGQDEEL
jgi:ABC-type multidrug transport system fused ATPase/permease subunit